MHWLGLSTHGVVAGVYVLPMLPGMGHGRDLDEITLLRQSLIEREFAHLSNDCLFLKR